MSGPADALRTIVSAVPGGDALKLRLAVWRLQRRRRRAWERARVCVVSFPKSGRTWVNVMLGRLASVDAQAGEAELELDVPNILFTHDDSDKPRQLLAVDAGRYAGKRVVLLVRDPRDVVASYYVHRYRRDRTYAGSVSEFLRDSGYGIRRIVDFMNAWWSQRDRPAAFMLVRYEDMHLAPGPELARLARFVGIDAGESRIADAVRFGAFDNMLAMERLRRARDPRLRPSDVADRDSYKVRRGEIGSWRKDIPLLEDQAFVDAVVTERLDRAFGYATP